MAIQIPPVFIFTIATTILIQTAVVECKFGSSFLGSLAGSALGKVLTGGKTKHHHHYFETPQTTIMRGETLANGCYKQTVKEPDMARPGKFIETQQLICPPAGGQAPPMGVPPMGVPPMGVPMVGVPGGIAQPSYIQQPMVPSAGNVVVLSKKTGSYYHNSSNVLTHLGIIGLMLAALGTCVVV